MLNDILRFRDQNLTGEVCKKIRFSQNFRSSEIVCITIFPKTLINLDNHFLFLQYSIPSSQPFLEFLFIKAWVNNVPSSSRMICIQLQGAKESVFCNRLQCFAFHRLFIEQSMDEWVHGYSVQYSCRHSCNVCLIVLKTMLIDSMFFTYTYEYRKSMVYLLCSIFSFCFTFIRDLLKVE